MSKPPVSLVHEREKRSVLPGDILSNMQADLESGEFPGAERAIAVIWKMRGDGALTPVFYSCGMNKAEEIGFLTALLQDRINNWMK